MLSFVYDFIDSIYLLDNTHIIKTYFIFLHTISLFFRSNYLKVIYRRTIQCEYSIFGMVFLFAFIYNFKLKKVYEKRLAFWLGA